MSKIDSGWRGIDPSSQEVGYASRFDVCGFCRRADLGRFPDPPEATDSAVRCETPKLLTPLSPGQLPGTRKRCRERYRAPLRQATGAAVYVLSDGRRVHG